MAHLSAVEMSASLDALYTSLFGLELYVKWKSLKERFHFASESEFVGWLLGVVDDVLTETGGDPGPVDDGGDTGSSTLDAFLQASDVTDSIPCDGETEGGYLVSPSFKSSYNHIAKRSQGRKRPRLISDTTATVLQGDQECSASQMLISMHAKNSGNQKSEYDIDQAELYKPRVPPITWHQTMPPSSSSCASAVRCTPRARLFGSARTSNPVGPASTLLLQLSATQEGSEIPSHFPPMGNSEHVP